MTLRSAGPGLTLGALLTVALTACGPSQEPATPGTTGSAAALDLSTAVCDRFALADALADAGFEPGPPSAAGDGPSAARETLTCAVGAASVGEREQWRYGATAELRLVDYAADADLAWRDREGASRSIEDLWGRSGPVERTQSAVDGWWEEGTQQQVVQRDPLGTGPGARSWTELTVREGDLVATLLLVSTFPQTEAGPALAATDALMDSVLDGLDETLATG